MPTIKLLCYIILKCYELWFNVLLNLKTEKYKGYLKNKFKIYIKSMTMIKIPKHKKPN